MMINKIIVNIFKIIKIFFIWVVFDILCDSNNVVNKIMIVVIILIKLLFVLNGFDNVVGNLMLIGFISLCKFVENFDVIKVMVIKYLVNRV